MAPIPTHPKLRWPLDVRLEKIGDDEILILTCPEGLTSQPLALVPAVAPILQCFDGQTSVDQIVAKFAQHGITHEIVNELSSLLANHLMLDTQEYHIAAQKLKADFQKATSRAAALAGLSYPSDPQQLSTRMRQILENASRHAEHNASELFCLVAPHIDYHRGHLGYAQAYTHLEDLEADLYVLIGTSHQYSRLLFHLTAKHFESPLGLLPCDTEFINRLARKYGIARSFQDELLHRKEHSLELQIPFMAHLQDCPRIAPILVGSFYGMLRDDRLPQQYPEYNEFVEAFAESIREEEQAGKSICFVAGVDMAHVGQHFGDSDRLSPEFMLEVEKRDKIYLDTITNNEKDQMFAHIAEDGDSRKICGFPTMYTLLDLFERLNYSYRSVVYDYRQAVDYSTDCAVTFASLGFYRIK